MNEDIAALIQLLSDECGWPIDPEMVNRSAWKLNNDELGLNDEVDIGVEVYELRPLVTKQPWGVFFLSVNGKSRLSVTLLRRLLRGLVKKKRATAEAASRKLWNLDDLMFVCSLDEPDNITRYFAHFKETEKGLPKLMIGARWEDVQDDSEIQKEVQKLRKHLHWPDDDTNIGAWRKQWNDGFQVGHREVIKTSTSLSRALARFAVVIKQNIPEIHRIEREDGPIHRLHEAFREALIKDLKLSDFADMVAQTITYGLFSARATGSELSGIETLSECIPSTNPFLRDLFSEFASLAGNEPTDLDFDDLSLSELVEMLNGVNIDAVMGDFGNQFKGGKEDPVIHFYETFLSEYDHQRRAERGVFYTPKPVVDFIVRSVHESLIEDFDLPLGLADTSTHIVNGKEWPKVMILDPATGTGTFLEAAIELINETMLHHWKRQGKSKSEISVLWNEYVDEDLLPRLFGFELMMAPYSIAHLKLGLKLQQTGYDSDSKNRLNVYLTNTLVEPAPLANWIPQFISVESEHANKVKNNIPITVILGNPPYSGESMNDNDWIRGLMRNELSDGSNDYFSVDGKPLIERTVKWINDDYVKFIRYSQYRIAESRFGIVGMITNNGYIDNPTFRGVRTSLMHTFDKIKIIDLHGSSNKKEISPDGTKDENVFDIRAGVGIGLFVRNNNPKTICSVYHRDIWGKRENKYQQLNDNTEIDCFNQLIPKHEFYLFIPRNEELEKEYNKGVKITLMMPLHGAGMTTARDKFAIDLDESLLIERIKKFGNATGSDQDVCDEFGIRLKPKWDCSKARYELGKITNYEDYTHKVSYRPFDIRWIFYHDLAVWRTVKKIMPQMINDNIGFAISRSVRGAPWRDILVTENMIEFGYIATRPGNTAPLFPLYIYNLKEINDKPKYNFSTNFLSSVTSQLSDDISPIDIFNYTYAILNSKIYRQRYQEFISIDFPKIPFTNNKILFDKLANYGFDLMNVQLMKSDSLEQNCDFHGKGDNIVSIMNEKSYVDGKYFINKDQYFSGITDEIYNFFIGSYRICHKWLKDRKGDKLSAEDIKHYKNVISVVSKSIDLMKEIDQVIEEHGGWPLSGSDEFEFDPNRESGQMGLGDF